MFQSFFEKYQILSFKPDMSTQGFSKIRVVFPVSNNKVIKRFEALVNCSFRRVIHSGLPEAWIPYLVGFLQS